MIRTVIGNNLAGTFKQLPEHFLPRDEAKTEDGRPGRLETGFITVTNESYGK